MSIEQKNVIDFISTNEESNSVVLTISDHLDWIDVKKHLLALQDKISTYLRFIESGEIYDSYADAKGKNIVINIIAKNELVPEGEEFIEKVKSVVHQAGFKLDFVQFDG